MYMHNVVKKSPVRGLKGLLFGLLYFVGLIVVVLPWLGVIR